MKSIALVVGALIGAAGCGRHAPEPAEARSLAPLVDGSSIVLPEGSPMLQQIRTEPVTLRDLATDELVAPGKVEANPNRVSKVVLPVTGRVDSVMVQIGDSVARGQPLLTVQSPDADAAAAGHLSAQAAIAQARSALNKAQADEDRAIDLFDHAVVAKKEVLAAESALVLARSALEQAQASGEQSLRRLAVLGLKAGEFAQHVVVRSPLAGKVLESSVVPGEFRNDANAAVMTIADLSTVWVSSQVPESYIRFVQVGEPVEVRLVAYPGELFTGSVSRIADTVDPQTRTVKVQAEMNNRDGRLRPEGYGTVHHIEATARILVVPAGSIVQGGGPALVFVESAPGRFEQRTVSLGKPDGDIVRVLGGLREGDRVVVDGAMLLRGLVAGRGQP